VPRSVTCPGCHRLLRVADDVTDAEVTCPRCLASVAVPQVSAITPQEPSAGRPTSCRRCGRRVEEQWRFCPYCEAVLFGPRRGARGGGFDDVVRRDRTGTNVLLILLAVLGGFGLLAYLAAAISTFKDGGAQLLIGIFVGVLFLAIISTGIMFWRTRNRPEERGIGRVIVGTLALTGGLFGAGCVLSVATFVFFFVACLVTGGRF
jgi:phage FluMu protein Com